MMRIPFMKLEGCGNSFVVVSELERSSVNWKRESAKLSRLDVGIGSDGLMVVEPSTTSDFQVTMYNPDSSPMGMCGNGIRCVCRYLVLSKRIPPHTENLTFEVFGRKIRCELREQGRVVRVDMGAPSLFPAEVPVMANGEVVGAPLEVDGQMFEVTALSMGNPHCVIFVDDVEKIDVGSLGKRIGSDKMFPDGANVEFVEVATSEQLKVKVCERGVGPTQACGTGACAALVAGFRQGLCGSHAVVSLPGGDLDIELDRKTGHVFLTGPAHEICEGNLFIGD